MSKEISDEWAESEDAGWDTGTLEKEQKRPKKPFSSLIRPDLEEKLNAAAFWMERSKADILDEALRQWIENQEEERGEPFEIWDRHKVQT